MNSVSGASIKTRKSKHARTLTGVASNVSKDDDEQRCWGEASGKRHFGVVVRKSARRCAGKARTSTKANSSVFGLGAQDDFEGAGRSGRARPTQLAALEANPCARVATLSRPPKRTPLAAPGLFGNARSLSLSFSLSLQTPSPAPPFSGDASNEAVRPQASPLIHHPCLVT